MAGVDALIAVRRGARQPEPPARPACAPAGDDYKAPVSAERKPQGPRDPLAPPPASAGLRAPRRLPAEPVSRSLPQEDRWEPGFLRLSPAWRGPALSLIVDAIGAPGDATAPSELEARLRHGGWETPELLRRAEAGAARLRRGRLSLDNDPGRRPLEGGERPVVVVDEPADSAAAGFALAGRRSFAAMLEAATAENPGAEVLIVMDPASRAAPERGVLMGGAVPAGATPVRGAVSAWSVAEGARRVYAVAAHVGFEAALARTPVTLFGVPFYAGWGFTDDRVAAPRRTRRRTPHEVFAAAYLLQSRYADPFSGEAIPFEAAVDLLELVVDRERANAVRTLGVGFAAWKRPWARVVLGGPGSTLRIAPAGEAPAPVDVAGADRVVVWGSREPAGVAEACARAGTPLVRMEDGFLRSVGLGVALRPGASYVLDALGMYYDASAPSDLERLLETADFGPDLLARAARLRRAVIGAGLSKYNVGGAPPPPPPAGRPVVLVAGQVEGDASLRLGGAPEVTARELLERVRRADPGAWIAYKPHPDVEAGLRPGHVPPRDLARLCDAVLHGVSAPDAIALADRVETATSLIGFEALLRGKPVRTHGLPFYAGWGLTDDPGSPRRTRRLTLDELVAGALILYPRYVDPVTSLPCPPEVVVRRLSERHPATRGRAWTGEAVAKALGSAVLRAGRRLRR